MGLLALVLSGIVVLGMAVPASATLTVTATDVVFPAVTLNGDDVTSAALAVSAYTIVDLRGTDAPWAVSVAASVPTSAPGTVESTPRTIAVTNLKVSTGSFAAALGSDPAVNITGTTDLTLSVSPQTLASATGDSTGTYTFLPTYSFTVPANAFRSNYSGAVGASPLNPFLSTITVTIS